MGGDARPVRPAPSHRGGRRRSRRRSRTDPGDRSSPRLDRFTVMVLAFAAVFVVFAATVLGLDAVLGDDGDPPLPPAADCPDGCPAAPPLTAPPSPAATSSAAPSRTTSPEAAPTGATPSRSPSSSPSGNVPVPDGLRAGYTTTGDWGSNFIGVFTVFNHGEADAGDWELTAVFPGRNITSAWSTSGRIRIEHLGTHLRASGGVLASGDRVQIFLQAEGRAGPPSSCLLDQRSCAAR